MAVSTALETTCQRYVMGSAPLAATRKAAWLPTRRVMENGLLFRLRLVRTVSVAVVLLVVPATFVTVTKKTALLSAGKDGVMV